MYITTETIVHAAEVLGAITALFAVLAAAVKWFSRQKEQDDDIREIKGEQCEICYALLACLDGLKQLGANGNVTNAYDRMTKHINKEAHDVS